MLTQSGLQPPFVAICTHLYFQSLFLDFYPDFALGSHLNANNDGQCRWCF
jgi:hypothetical protein